MGNLPPVVPNADKRIILKDIFEFSRASPSFFQRDFFRLANAEIVQGILRPLDTPSLSADNAIAKFLLRDNFFKIKQTYLKRPVLQ